MLDSLRTTQSAALAELAAVADQAALEGWRVEYLGSKGKVRAAMGAMKDVAPGDKPAYGQAVNAMKAVLEAEFALRAAAMAASGSSGPAIDLTEPGVIQSSALGRRHIISRVRDELVDVFGRMGFEVATGPELEDDEHNFIKLNIPAEHPARDPIDNFYVDNPATTQRPRMLRSQTSTVQIRTMEDAVARGWGPPLKVVSPGRVYRPDTVDATHSFMFHQIEGLYIDRDVTMVDLQSTLMHFARAYFSPDAEVRLRPSFFPFTEPSAEFDMKIALKPGQAPGWVELGGCGMVDPNVLSACGIDPEEWTGFAFGFGIERIAMGKYGIPDIRMLFENDLRFLSQV
ncbi:MAG: phenylalanine--tRNA ligase subunit alpha [Phycisphaeraceae bacterium]|nr:phenylalanine--tRNA ligase subunit alpha [Phycisphaeraceae bacterium]MCW5762595.1 phenylalanine--tRNA ligase subunit alpha [Phycisphaeraceae bacterium]